MLKKQKPQSASLNAIGTSQEYHVHARRSSVLPKSPIEETATSFFHVLWPTHLVMQVDPGGLAAAQEGGKALHHALRAGRVHALHPIVPGVLGLRQRVDVHLH